MSLSDLVLLSRRERARLAVLVVVLIAVSMWASFRTLDPGPPRKIVLASGNENGVYHRHALRYIALLKQEGVMVQERMTAGAAENLQLLLDPKSGVDVAFLQGGIATFPEANDLTMLASLYYEPLWIFYRDAGTMTQLTQLHGKRIAVAAPGSGTRQFALQMLAANGVVDSTFLSPLGGPQAIAALKSGDVDAALIVGGAQTPAIQEALRDPLIRAMSLDRADAYTRRFPFVSKLTLPPGTIDLATNIPGSALEMIGTKAMLASRDGLHPALINLLVDAAREIHSEQGYFEAAGEFPGIAPVDLRVSPDADQHRRFGPSLLYRYLPFWLAALVERAIIVLVPLAVILIPVLNIVPRFLHWRVRSRIFRQYGELALLEREVATGADPLPVERWLRDLERIDRSVEGVKTPRMFASEAYTLREHVELVRRKILAKAGMRSATSGRAALSADARP